MSVSEFRTALLNFINDLVDQFPEESDLKSAQLIVSNILSEKLIYDMFVTHFYTYKDKIVTENEEFFLNNDSVFNMVNGKQLLQLKNIWLSDNLDASDKEAIWAHLKYLLIIADKIQGKQR